MMRKPTEKPMRGEPTRGTRTLRTRPWKFTALGPAWAQPAPMSPPMRAWDEDEGMPNHQVKKFQKMAPTRAASTRMWQPSTTCG